MKVLIIVDKLMINWSFFTTKSYYNHILNVKNFTHITGNIWMKICLAFDSFLATLTWSLTISFSSPQPFVWASWNFLGLSHSSWIGSFRLSFRGFCAALRVNRARGHPAESPLVPRWPLMVPELKGSLPPSPTMLTAWRVAGVCVKVVGVQEWVAVPQPAAQRWPALLWPLTAKVEVKVFHGGNEWF